MTRVLKHILVHPILGKSQYDHSLVLFKESCIMPIQCVYAYKGLTTGSNTDSLELSCILDHKLRSNFVRNAFYFINPRIFYELLEIRKHKSSFENRLMK